MPSVTGVAQAGSGLGGFFHFHQTHTAVGGDRQFFVVAEMRNIGAQFVRRFHHSRALLDCNLFTVDFDL